MRKYTRRLSQQDVRRDILDQGPDTLQPSDIAFAARWNADHNEIFSDYSQLADNTCNVGDKTWGLKEYLSNMGLLSGSEAGWSAINWSKMDTFDEDRFVELFNIIPEHARLSFLQNAKFAYYRDNNIELSLSSDFYEALSDEEFNVFINNVLSRNIHDIENNVTYEYRYSSILWSDVADKPYFDSTKKVLKKWLLTSGNFDLSSIVSCKPDVVKEIFPSKESWLEVLNSDWRQKHFNITYDGEAHYLYTFLNDVGIRFDDFDGQADRFVKSLYFELFSGAYYFKDLLSLTNKTPEDVGIANTEIEFLLFAQVTKGDLNILENVGNFCPVEVVESLGQVVKFFSGTDAAGSEFCQFKAYGESIGFPEVLSDDQTAYMRNAIVDLNRYVSESDHEDSVFFSGYQALRDYIGDAKNSDDLIWRYIGKDRHDRLHFLPEAIGRFKEFDDPRAKQTFIELLRLAGTGSGNQAVLFRKIVTQLDNELFATLSKTSVYPNSDPPLQDMYTINMSRLYNEVRLLNSEDLKFFVTTAYEHSEHLGDYVVSLTQTPDISIDAIDQFITDPSAFFNSRTGAGEDHGTVAKILDAMSPDMYPGWNARESRDAIITGAYDRIKPFPQLSVEWCDDVRINNLEQRISELFEHCNSDSINTNVAIAKVLKIVRGFSKELDAIVRSDLEGLAREAFNNAILNDTEKFAMHLKEKGSRIIERSCQYYTKRKIAPLQRRILKYSGKYASDIRKKAELEKEVAEFQEYIDRYRDTAKAIMDKPSFSEDDIGEFWRSTLDIGAFNNKDMNFIVSRVAGKKITDEVSLIGEYVSPDTVEKWSTSLVHHIKEESSAVWYKAEVVGAATRESAIVGTMTGSCDLFGSGKRAHFMTNPGVGQFVLSRKVGGRDWDIADVLSQSTITKDVSIFESSDDRNKYQDALSVSEGRIGKVLRSSGLSLTSQDLLDLYQRADIQIGYDSVEISESSKEVVSPDTLFDAMKIGVDKMADVDSLYGAESVIGTQYGYIRLGKKVPNLSTWTTPIAYSDNVNKQAVLLREGSVGIMRDEEVGVRPMRGDDAFVVSLMEDIAYSKSGGENYITGFFAMSREVYASVLQSGSWGLNPMSFIDIGESKDGEKQFNGYLLAYLEHKEGDIYITDTSSMGRDLGTGRRLIKELLNSAGSDSGLNTKVIKMDSRGATSARLLARDRFKKAISNIRVETDDGRIVQYTVEGPRYEDISGDSLYQFSFVPQFVE